MGSTPAMGNGPFEFTDGKGKHWSIPLTAFNFVGAQVVVDPAWQFLTNVQPAKSYLAYAVSAGVISPAPAPSPFPAMVIQAVTPGTGGNNIKISVAISNVVTSPPTDDPTLTPFSLTVIETDTYTGLTAASIQTTLQGGLVQATSVDTTGSPLSASGSLTLTGPPGAPAQLEVHGSGSPSLVFTLVAKAPGADGELTQVTITPDTSSPPSSWQETFTLAATWTKTVPGITLATLETLVSSQLGYEITVSKPSSGAYSVPAAGSSTLSGGAQGSNAAATLFTGN